MRRWREAATLALALVLAGVARSRPSEARVLRLRIERRETLLSGRG